MMSRAEYDAALQAEMVAQGWSPDGAAKEIARLRLGVGLVLSGRAPYRPTLRRRLKNMAAFARKVFKAIKNAVQPHFRALALPAARWKILGSTRFDVFKVFRGQLPLSQGLSDQVVKDRLQGIGPASGVAQLGDQVFTGKQLVDDHSNSPLGLATCDPITGRDGEEPRAGTGVAPVKVEHPGTSEGGAA